MTTLAELIEQHNVEMTPIYTHTVDSGRDNRRDYDVYDVLLTIDAGISLYGGRFNKRTMLVRGVEQAPVLSRANNGDNLIPPVAEEALSDLLSNAANIDNEPNWRTWGVEYSGGSGTFHDGMDAYEAYQESRRVRDELLRFLGGSTDPFSLYDQFMRADRD